MPHMREGRDARPAVVYVNAIKRLRTVWPSLSVLVGFPKSGGRRDLARYKRRVPDARSRAS